MNMILRWALVLSCACMLFQCRSGLPQKAKPATNGTAKSTPLCISTAKCKPAALLRLRLDLARLNCEFLLGKVGKLFAEFTVQIGLRNYLGSALRNIPTTERQCSKAIVNYGVQKDHLAAIAKASEQELELLSFLPRVKSVVVTLSEAALRHLEWRVMRLVEKRIGQLITRLGLVSRAKTYGDQQWRFEIPMHRIDHDTVLRAGPSKAVDWKMYQIDDEWSGLPRAISNLAKSTSLRLERGTYRHDGRETRYDFIRASNPNSLRSFLHKIALPGGRQFRVLCGRYNFRSYTSRLIDVTRTLTLKINGIDVALDARTNWLELRLHTDKEALRRFTKKSLGKRVLIEADGRALSDPLIMEDIKGGIVRVLLPCGSPVTAFTTIRRSDVTSLAKGLLDDLIKDDDELMQPCRCPEKGE